MPYLIKLNPKKAGNYGFFDEMSGVYLKRTSQPVRVERMNDSLTKALKNNTIVAKKILSADEIEIEKAKQQKAQEEKLETLRIEQAASIKAEEETKAKAKVKADAKKNKK